MPAEELNGVIAIVGGLVLAVIAFVPAAAAHYRRHGRFSAADLAALVVPVYGLALWTYTLLPFPDGDWVCTTPLYQPGRFVSDLRSVWDGSIRSLVHTQVFAQLALNVALFVPLGAILRLRYRRGVLWALLTGFAISLLIETTQLTGTWGLFRCSYRFFEADDLIMNTSGAVLGSVLVMPLAAVLARHRHVEAPVTEPTTGRRFVAMISDALVMIATAGVTLAVWRVWVHERYGTPLTSSDLDRSAFAQWGVAFALEAVIILATGRTIGEFVVGLRTVSRSRRWTPVARVVKILCGVAPFCALWAWNSPVSGVALVAMVAVTALVVPFSRGHRGLANAAAGLDTEVVGARRLDSRPPAT